MLEEEIKIEQDKLREIIQSFQREGIDPSDQVFKILEDCIGLASMAILSGEPTIMAKVLGELKKAYSDMMKAMNHD